MDLFDDPKRSAAVAMGLGVVGAVFAGIGFGVGWVPLQVASIVILMLSGLTWAIRGVMEDQTSETQ